jgi:hypothetical protein
MRDLITISKTIQSRNCLSSGRGLYSIAAPVGESIRAAAPANTMERSVRVFQKILRQPGYAAVLMVGTRGRFISLPAASANRPIAMPETSPTSSPVTAISSLGVAAGGMDFIIAASCG